jgi:hypothetical protein
VDVECKARDRLPKTSAKRLRPKKNPGFEGRAVSGVGSVRAEIHGIDEYSIMRVTRHHRAFKIAAGLCVPSGKVKKIRHRKGHPVPEKGSIGGGDEGLGCPRCRDHSETETIASSKS